MGEKQRRPRKLTRRQRKHKSEQERLRRKRKALEAKQRPLGPDFIDAITGVPLDLATLHQTQPWAPGGPLTQHDREIWKETKASFRYEVSSYGRVRAKKTGRLKTITVDGSGYPRVTLYFKGGRSRRVGVHVLVCRAFIGPCPKGYVPRPLDGDYTNLNRSNWVWVVNDFKLRVAERRRDLALQIQTRTFCQTCGQSLDYFKSDKRVLTDRSEENKRRYAEQLKKFRDDYKKKK